MMKHVSITFLDQSTVDLGDIDLGKIKKQGRFTSYKLTDDDQVVSRAMGADVLIINKCVLGASELAALPNLKLICVAATGVNNVDLAEAKKRRIAVTNVAGYSTTTVAEATILFLLALGHRLHEHHRASLDGMWGRSSSFTVLNFPFTDIQGKTLGIIGYGAIGKRVSHLAKAFGMNILIAKIPGRKYRAHPRRHSLEEIFGKSDFVSLHCPLTDGTRRLVNTKRLALMKKTAFLINMARGPIVDDAAVAEALREGRLAGFAADVLTHEPPPGNHPFFVPGVREKVLLTPHVAWASRESRQRLMNEIGKNIEAFRRGQKRNRVV